MSENNVVDIKNKKKTDAPTRSNKIVGGTKVLSAREALEKYGSFTGLQFRLKKKR